MTFFAFFPENRAIVVFTDLDGTLLDHSTYRFDAALPALHSLRHKNIPLVLCSSKTRAEMERLRAQLRLNDPFITENGAAIFVPHGYFHRDFPHDKVTQAYAVRELGTPYSKLRAFLAGFKEQYPNALRGFGDLEAEEVARLCGLSLEEARLAKLREYDEPFVLRDMALEPEIVRQAKACGSQVTRGGRFHHLTGGNDKGRAVSILTDQFQRESGEIVTIGIGDSQNDLPMLRAVNYPVLVQKPDRSYDPAVKLPNLILASTPGPTGFRESVSKLIDALA